MYSESEALQTKAFMLVMLENEKKIHVVHKQARHFICLNVSLIFRCDLRVSDIKHQPSCVSEVLRKIAYTRCGLGNIATIGMDFSNHAIVSTIVLQRNRYAKVIKESCFPQKNKNKQHQITRDTFHVLKINFTRRTASRSLFGIARVLFSRLANLLYLN